MSKKLTDEQADQLLKTLVTETSVSDELINEIADSAQLKWAVQRNIASQQPVEIAPWPPSFNWLRFLGFATPVVAALLIIISIFIFRPTQRTEQAELQQNDQPQMSITSPATQSAPVAPQLRSPEIDTAKTEALVDLRPRKPASESLAKMRTEPSNGRPPETVAKQEVRSDFIDLTYAQRPESGQIVRVKVPNSMKVSLGIASSVDKPSELVDAEVLVGDDGMTHAIRFISGGQK